MGSISAEALTRSVESAMGWPYVSPGSNNSDGIDCSGLLVYGFRQNGGSIYHGSNTIYRSYLTEKGKLTSAKQLIPGMAVFKWNPNTPAKFHDGLGDFQHVGVVTRVNPLRIVHASSVAGKVIADTKIGKWKFWGKLKGVDYGGDSMGILDDIMKAVSNQQHTQATTATDLQPTTQTDLNPLIGNGTSSAPAGAPSPEGEGYTRTVTASSGSTVRVREAPGGAKICELRVGTKVTAIGGKKDSLGREWTKIRYDAEGWMMSKFLKGGE